MDTLLSGRCLCGAVQVSTRMKINQVGACHCDICRTWGGGPMLAIGGEDTHLDGEQSIAIYSSTAWAERGFCKQCGTHLFIRVKQSGRMILPAGLFGATPALHFDHQIFVDRKPDYYEFANATKNMTGAEVFAQHAPVT